MKQNIFNLTRLELEKVLDENFSEVKPYHAKELFRWIYRRHVLCFREMTNLSKRFREELLEFFSFDESRLLKVSSDPTDGARKLLIQSGDGLRFESVIIPTEKRVTLCISSQVGCAMACTFCLTGQMGFLRNLSVSEIVEQLRFAEKTLMGAGKKQCVEEHVISNIVFMGMGEPLLNLDVVGRAIEIMEDRMAFGYSKRRITVSTCGIIDRMLEIPQLGDPNLAISLNAPSESLRSVLMPVNKKYSLRELFAVLKRYPLERGRCITFEYVLLRGVNDSIATARELVSLLKAVPSKINLIYFNEFDGALYTRPPDEVALRFQRFLLDSGIQTNLRISRGRQIGAACGQLATK